MLTLDTTQEKTGLGNYFVANYPPFAAWKPEHLAAARAALNRPPQPGTPLGLYLHVPFCASKCHFCDWVVGYDKGDLLNVGGLRQQYVEALPRHASRAPRARAASTAGAA